MLQHSPYVQTFGFIASGCTVWQVWNIQTSLIIDRVFSQMVQRTFSKFSSVLLADEWSEGSKSITEVWLVLEHQYHSNGVSRKGSFKHFISLNCWFLTFEAKLDAYSLCCQVCRSTGIEWAENKLITDVQKLRSHRNTTFCYSDTHHTNSK